MSTASYLRHGRGRSLNGMAAMESGRYPASHVARAIGGGCTARFISECAPHSGEWHHTGKFAAAVAYYHLDTVSDWVTSEDGQVALTQWKQRQPVAEVGHETEVADVTLEHWTREAINRFGKLGWRKHTHSFTAVEVRPVGTQFWHVEGWGRISREKCRVVFLTKTELTKRRRCAAAKKAAATRAANAQRAARAAALQCIAAAVLSAPRLLALPAPRIREVAEWAAAGCPQPAGAEITAAKHASGLSWAGFAAAAKNGTIL